MTRRKIVAILAPCVAFHFLGALQTLCRLTTLGTAEPAIDPLTGFFARRQSAHRVGLEYLRGAPWEANRAVLIQLLYEGRTVRFLMHDRRNPGAIRRLILSQQRDDFARGRIVQLQGWILSQTEARLCALVALG